MDSKLLLRKITDMLIKTRISRDTSEVRSILRVIIVALKTTKISTNTIQITSTKKLKVERILMRLRQNGSKNDNRGKLRIRSTNIKSKLIISNNSLGTVVITGILTGTQVVMEKNTKNTRRHRKHNTRNITNSMRILKILNFTMKTLRAKKVALEGRKATKTCTKNGKHKEKLKKRRLIKNTNLVKKALSTLKTVGK